MSITVEHTSKFYGNQKALNNVSFSVESGEIVGFLGPNGAGKSTMMKILTAYLEPQEGKVTVNGFDVLLDELNVKKTVGYLPEHNPLYLDMYVQEYLQFNANIHNVSKSRIEEVIEMVGLSPEKNKKIEQLSKGYRQRVGLAAALLHDPQVLILDEPTTGLDPNQLIGVRELIKEIGKTKTILLSTHIMQEVEAMCDRVIIIKKGEIVADQKLITLLDDQSQTIEVEFNQNIEKQFLEHFEFLKSFENLYGNFYLLRFNTEIDMREVIFDFAKEKGVKILHLSRKNKDLESMFQELTN